MTTPILADVTQKLGGVALLGVDVRSQADLARAVRNRLPLSILAQLAAAGLTEAEIRSGPGVTGRPSSNR